MDVYRELKKEDYGLYVKTIETASALCIKANLNLNESANLEATLIEFALMIRQRCKKDFNKFLSDMVNYHALKPRGFPLHRNLQVITK